MAVRDLRTLSEMSQRVLKHLRSVRSNRFDPSDVKEKMEDAAETIWNLLVDDNRGQRVLRKVTGDADLIPLVADQKDYSQPNDVLRIKGIEISRTVGADVKWQELAFMQEARESYPVSGNCRLYGSLTSGNGVPVCWNDRADLPNAIRIYPTPAVAGESLRFIYYHAPAFPRDDDDSFNKVDGSVVDYLPLGIDTCVEYMAAALLSGEELDDGVPIGYFGDLFSKKYLDLLGGPGGGTVRRKHRYVRRRRYVW